MTALHMIWLSSGAGAAIFFALGYVVRVFARAPDGAAKAPGGAAAVDADELARLKVELATGDRQRAEIAKELEARTREARGAANEIARLRDSLSDSEARRARVEKTPIVSAGGDGDVDTAVAPAPIPEGVLEAESSEDETTKVNTRASELVAAADELVVLRERAEEAEAKGAAAEQARVEATAETETLTRKLAIAERATEREQQRRAKADRERLEAKTELATVRAENAAIEETRDKLAKNIASSKGAQGKVDSLREENAQLRIEVERLSEARDKLAAAREAKDKAESELRKVETEAHTLRADEERAAAVEKKLAAVERQNAELRASGSLADTSTEELSRARQTIKALERELDELKATAEERLAEERLASGDGAAELDTVKAELASLKVEANRAEMRMTELELLREENRNLRDEIGELEQFRSDAPDMERLQAETSHLRMQTQVTKRKEEELEEVATEKAALAEEVDELRHRAAESERLGERVASLEAQLFAAGIEPKGEGQQEAGQGERVSYVGLDVALSSLAAVANLRAAVVADDMGLVIAGAGKTEYHEDVAALSGLARHLADRAQDLLPLDDIQQIALEDANRVVLTCRLFSAGSEAFALSMLGTKVSPPRELIDKHVRSLLKTLA